MSRNQYPFLRIVIVFVFGIWVGTSTDLFVFSCYNLLSLLLISFLFCSYLHLRSKKQFQYNWYGTVIFGMFFWIGVLSVAITDYIEKPVLSSEIVESCSYYTAVIQSKADSTEKFIKYAANIKKIHVNGDRLNMDKKALLYFKKGTSCSFAYGDELLIIGKPQFIVNNKNPAAFDYGLFLQRKGIFLQDFIMTDDFTVINPGHKVSPVYWGFLAGDFMEKTLSKYIPSSRELNVIKAMLIGRRNEIASEMTYAYQSTGTSHILAVSGLHVGIIYLIVSGLFKFLKGRKPKWLFYAIVIFSVWSFAFITGFSPSVQRAAVMFSFILIGKYGKRKSNIYNTIAASAFFILLLSPNLIYSVSFQLSYAAVLGIVWLYPKIYPLLYIQNRVFDFFWQITVLSVSVQIVTFPITIFYFNQFPILFALTNLVAIPTAIVVIFGSLAILLTSFIAFVPDIIGTALYWWISVYNEIMLYVSRLTIALVSDIHFKIYHILFLILSVVFLIYFLDKRKLEYFRYFTFTVLVFGSVFLIERYKKSIRQQIIFYQVDDRFYFDIFLGNSCFTNITAENDEERDQVYFNISPYRASQLTEKIESINKMDFVKSIGKNTLILKKDFSVLVLNDPDDISKQNSLIEIDYLVINKGMMSKIPEIMDIFHIRNLILDNTVDFNFYKSIRDQIGKEVNIHSLKQDGAYIIGI